MSWFLKVLGNATQNVAEVDANNQLLVGLAQDPTKAGNVKILDSAGKDILTTENGAIGVSQAALLLFEQVDGSTVNSNVWNTTASTMTIAQANGFIMLNSGADKGANDYAIISSIKYMPMYGYLPLHVTLNAMVPMAAQANAVAELGIGLVSTNAAPTDGCFFRWNASAQLLVVVSNGGAETTSTALTVPSVTEAALFEIIVVEDQVLFRIDDVLAAAVQVPPGFAFPTNNGRLPVFARVYNGSSSPANAPQIQMGQVVVVQESTSPQATWDDVLMSLGRGAYQSPVAAFAQTANHANSTSPVSATLSNTAAGYTTLGGRWQFAAPAGAATDYALFAYQVPVGFQLHITNVAISSAVTGAAIVTATLLDWAIGLNASGVSLATADGAGTWAPRRIPLGIQGIVALAGIGQVANDVSRRFEPPVVVDGGRYLHIIVQVPSGAATIGLIFRGDVIVSGYFE